MGMMTRAVCWLLKKCVEKIEIRIAMKIAGSQYFSWVFKRRPSRPSCRKPRGSSSETRVQALATKPVPYSGRCVDLCLARCELADRLTGLVGDRRLGIEADGLFQFALGARRVLELFVGHAEMVAVRLVVGHGFHGRFEQRCSSRVRTGPIVRPAERVGGVRQVWQPFATGLREAQGHVDVAAVFEKQVGQIVGGQWLVWL